MWSIGIAWLELLFGTPHVFEFGSHAQSQALLESKLQRQGRSERSRRLAHLLHGMMAMCIYPPREPPAQKPMPGAEMAGDACSALETFSQHCKDEDIMDLIKSQEPSGVGIDGISAVRLLMRLLAWRPGQRITAAEALQHEYFQL